MKMIKTSLATALLITLAGCQSTSTQQAEVAAEPVVNMSQEEVVAFMKACNNPDSTVKGPISNTLFVVGSFGDSNWTHVSKRKYSYKGNNIYQAVIQEKAGSYKMQYASRMWSPQFTAKDKKLSVGEHKPLVFGGYGTDTETKIEQDGQYVWSLQFDAKGKPLSVMVNPCQ